MKSLRSRINDIKQCNSKEEIVNIIFEELLKIEDDNKKETLDYNNHPLDTLFVEGNKNLNKYANSTKKGNGSKYIDNKFIDDEMQKLYLYTTNAFDELYRYKCKGNLELFKNKIIAGEKEYIRYLHLVIIRDIKKENATIGANKEIYNTISLDTPIKEGEEMTLGDTQADPNNAIDNIFNEPIDRQIEKLKDGIFEKNIVGEIFNIVSKPQKEFLMDYTFEKSKVYESRLSKMKPRVFNLIKKRLDHKYKTDLKGYIEEIIEKDVAFGYIKLIKRKDFIMNLDILNIEKQLSDENKHILSLLKKGYKVLSKEDLEKREEIKEAYKKEYKYKVTESDLVKLEKELISLLKKLIEN